MYRSFECGRPPFFTVNIRGAASQLKRRRLQQKHHLELEAEGGRVHIIKRRIKGAPYRLGRIDPRARTCFIRLADINDMSTLRAAVRLCFQYFIERGGGILLHAAAGKVNGEVYVFTGKSGAGKTTALMNSSPDEITAEDVAVLKVCRGGTTLFSTPFRGEQYAQGRVKALFFPLKKAGRPYIEPVSPPRALAEIMANVIMASPGDAQCVGDVMTRVLDLCARVPVYDLYFPKEGDLRKVLAV
jgi:hypothetical protein